MQPSEMRTEPKAQVREHGLARRLDPALLAAVIAENKAADELNEAERKYRIARARTAREAARVTAAKSPSDKVSDCR